MSADLKPPDIEITTVEEVERLRHLDRTPRPYHRDGTDVEQDAHSTYSKSRLESASSTVEEAWVAGSGQSSVLGSESGTEADDERPTFVKALPAPQLRPRKGLKTGEQSEDVLLTPSQLDDEGRSLLRGYFKNKDREKAPSQEEQRVEQEKLSRVRRAELARRCSEVGLTVVMILCVLCGRGVWQVARLWPRELLAHVFILATLILAYPIKLAIVDSRSQSTKLWRRVRVPASFDPATVLYPPLLPVMVALSVCPISSAVIMPNIILGLASLPQRLFPRSSRIGGINVFHWFVSIIPLIASEYTARPWKHFPAMPYMIKSGPPEGLWPETLATLYPLHHALLQPLHYLTTTSLLVSELHLLSAGLINVLLLAKSPQVVIIKACLWIGGVLLLMLCTPILHWNVTLMRVPKWKLRRSGHPVEERKSFVDTVSDLVGFPQAAATGRGTETEDSDADEDKPKESFKNRSTNRPQLSLSQITFNAFDWARSTEPKSAIEPRMNTREIMGEPKRFGTRPRRNTLPVQETPAIGHTESRATSGAKSPHLLWCLYLTPAQAEGRKWTYAAYVYACIALVILIPVRRYALERALAGYEPIGWALGYLFGEVQPLRESVQALGLNDWVSLPQRTRTWTDVAFSFPPNVPALRETLGAANVRLLLIAYWGIVLLFGLLTVFSLTALVEVDTRRKVFHGVMVAMLLPATFVDPCACALALALILTVFLLLEVIRAGQVVPLGNAIGRFVAPYVDGRDLRGPVVVSHIFLLIGCAVPLWFSLASINRAGEAPWTGWDLANDQREVAMVAGVICVGMGDAAASLIGRRYGRHKWMWVGGKSLEGSAAFAVAVTIGLVAAKVWLAFGGWADMNGSLDMHTKSRGSFGIVGVGLVTLMKAAFCACGASFMEAVLTGANDNVVVPVALWLLVKGVRL